MQPRDPSGVVRLAGALAAILLGACGREPTAVQAPPAPPPVVRAAPPTAAPRPAAEATWGEPDGPGVKRFMRQRAGEVRRCYEAALAQDARARGKLTLRFTIVESGALEGVTVARSTFRGNGVPSCVRDVVERWRTPFRPAEPVEVEYPFSFSPR